MSKKKIIAKLVKKPITVKTKTKIKKEVIGIKRNNVKNKNISKNNKNINKKVIKKIINSNPKPKEFIVDSKKITDIQLLENFLGGQNKVKLWKVFVLNTTREFELKDLLKLTRIKKDSLILELRDLMRLGLIKGIKKENHILYKTNINFPLLQEITDIILSVIPRSVDKILEKLNSLNKLKIVLLSGFFTTSLGKQKSLSNSLNSNIDLLLVFEKIPDNVDLIISELEYNIGKELSYSSLDQNDFKYRHSIGDKLIRDVLDFDHVIAMDKISFFR